MQHICPLLFFLIALPVSAQGLLQRYKEFLTPPPHYECLHTTSPITIDGHLNESDWKRASHTSPFIDIRGKDSVPTSHRTTAQLLWDEDYLYVAATLSEPNIVARLRQRDTIIWKENDFEVFLDPSGKGTHYYEFEVNALGTMMDLLMTHPYRSGGSFIMPWDCVGLSHAIALDGTLNQPSDKDRAWTVEMAIPIKTLRHNFDYQRGGTAGEVWRLNFSRVQWLKTKGPEENWVWAPTGKIDIHMPERWGYLHFLEKPQELLPPTPASPLLWAIFYAQLDYKQKRGHYAQNLQQLGLSTEDRLSLSAEERLVLEASTTQFRISLSHQGQEKISIDHRGECLYVSPSAH